MATQGDSLIGGMGQAQTPAQISAGYQSAQAAGQPTTQTQGGNAYSIAGSPDPTTMPSVNSTQDASQINSQISNNSTGVIFPQAPGAATQGTTANAQTPNPIPSAADIISQGTQQTPAEQTNQTLLQKVAGLIGSNKGQQTLTNTAEANAGIPAMQSSLNDLNSQLEALSNQSLSLQNDASAGGTIQNNEQNQAQGRGITVGGLAPLTAADLRNNQVQQAAIASQSLTLKSAVFALQGKISLAQTAADNAAKAQYEDEQNQINYMQALIAANAPQMTKEEKAQADLVTANLADRQTQIAQAQDNKKSIIAAAVATMQAYPNNPAAQYAAQQALNESNQQNPDLAKALSLMSAYPSQATQLAAQQLTNAKLDTQIKQQQLATSINDQNAAPVDPNSTSILAQTGLSIAAFNYLTQGTSALSRLSSTDRQKVMNEAQAFTAKSGTDLSTLQSQYTAYNNVLQQNIQRRAQTQVMGGEIMGTVQNLKDAISSIANSKGGIFGIGSHTLSTQNILDLAAGKAVNNPVATQYSTQIATLANDYAGYLAASRTGNLNSVDDADKRTAAEVISNGLNSGSLQAFSDAIKQNEDKITGVVNSAVDSAAKSVWDLFGVGDKYQNKYSSGGQQTIQSNGKTYNVGQTYQDASGANWTVDANGNWTKQ